MHSHVLMSLSPPFRFPFLDDSQLQCHYSNLNDNQAYKQAHELTVVILKWRLQCMFVWLEHDRTARNMSQHMNTIQIHTNHKPQTPTKWKSCYGIIYINIVLTFLTIDHFNNRKYWYGSFQFSVWLWKMIIRLDTLVLVIGW